MAKLVIVESPAKAKTIGKYLGKDYEVTASMGHIRDLPASQLGIDIEHDYAPQYISIKGKEKLIKELKSKAKHSDGVLLATDPDREGEAISWHLANILGLDPHEPNRVTFDEITKKGVKEGMAHPRAINEDLFNAQQARRVLDRLVGYKLSPFLWRKVRRGLSAGRVQSVAVRIIDDREKEIEAFKPEEYWNVDATLGVGRKSFTARLASDDKGKKLLPHSEAEARAIEKGLEGAEYTVGELKKGKRAKQPTPAFITSTLQQEASKALNFPISKTMRIAQQLYEGVDVKGQGTVGLITYLRTDSVRISEEADAAARTYISEQYGQNYVSQTEKTVKNGQKIQDAHEAIRPTDITRTPVLVKESLTRDQFRLYQLIWRRFAASRMAPARYETTSVKIGAGEYVFTVAASKVAFDGFMSVYTEEGDDKKGNILSQSLEKGMELTAFHAVAGLVAGECSGLITSLIAMSLEKRLPGHSYHTLSGQWKTMGKLFSSMAVPLTINRVTTALFNSLENLLIPQKLQAFGYSASDALSIFGILTGMTMSIILFPSVLTNSFSVLLLPAVSEAHSAHNHAQIARAIKKAILYGLLLGFVFTILFLVFGDRMGEVLFHNTLAGNFICQLSWLCPLLYVTSLLNSILHGLGNARQVLFVTLLACMIRICMILFLVPQYGIDAYLWGMLLSYVFAAIADILLLMPYSRA